MSPERLTEITERAARAAVGDFGWSGPAAAFTEVARTDIPDLVGALRELQGLQSDAIGELLATVEVLHRLTRDMELACYFVPAEQLMERAEVLEGLAERLREAAKGTGQDGTA